MKKLHVLIISILLTITALPIIAEESKGETYADIGLFSNYVWRGQKLSEGSVMQPSIGLIYKGFGINFWSNFDQKSKQHNETDITLDYTFSTASYEFNLGYIYYAIDGPGSDETGEIFLTATYDSLLAPSITIYYDTDEGDGGFLEFAIGHTLEISDNIQLDISALAGYNLSNSLMEEEDKAFNGFYNGDLSVSLPYSITEDISLEILAAYSFPLSDEAEKAILDINSDYGGSDSELFYGGITLSLAF